MENSLGFLRNGMTILVYSNSTTVLDVLLYSWNKGVKFNVIACETRPKNEGIAYSKLIAD